MNIAQRHHDPERQSAGDDMSAERYLRVLQENMLTDELHAYLVAQRNGRPDFSSALSVARNSDGLIRSDGYCEARIMDAVEVVCLGWEAATLKARDMTRGRQRLAEYRVGVANMRLLATRLAGHAQFIATCNCGMEKYMKYGEQAQSAIEKIKVAAEGVDDFIKGQEKLLKQSGGNRRVFDRMFVRKMRAVWKDITGRDAGRARTPVVEFATAVWAAYNFDPRREGSRFAWLADRFKKIG